MSEVTTLEHELGDNSVEDGSLEVQGLAGLAHSLLASAESSEVLGSLGDSVGVQLHDDTTGGLVVHGDVKEDLGVGHFRNRFTLRRSSYAIVWKFCHSPVLAL